MERTRASGRRRGAQPRGAVHPFRFFSQAPTDPEGWLQIFPVGKYTYGDIGTIEITAERCANFVRNFADNARGHAIPVNREHVAELGAVGWFSELETRDTGVWAKIDWTDEGKDLVTSGAFKFFSPEFYEEFSDPKSQKVVKDLLVGGALTNYPRFFDMVPIAASEAIASELRKAAESFEERIEDVREAIEETYGYYPDIWRTEGDTVVVRWMDGWWKFPYTIGANGEISLGMPAEVEQTFTPVSTTAAERFPKKFARNRPSPKEETMEGKDPKPAATAATTTPAPSAATTASEGQPITAAEATQMREEIKRANERATRSEATLRLMAANDVIEAAKRAGKIVPAEDEFWRKELTAASEERFGEITKYLGDKPAVITLGAVGSAEAAVGDDVTRTKLHAMAERYAEEHKVPYKDALLHVSKTQEAAHA